MFPSHDRGTVSPLLGAAQMGIGAVTDFGVSKIAAGTVDFAKLLTVDAFIGAGQMLGLIDENGTAEAIQNFSVQRESEEGVRIMREGISSGLLYAVSGELSKAVGDAMAAGYAGQMAPVVVNTNAPQTSTVSVSGGTSYGSVATTSNGSSADAYAQ